VFGWAAELVPDEIAQRQHITDFLTTTDGLALTTAFTRIKDLRLHRGIIRLVEKSPAAVNHIRIIINLRTYFTDPDGYQMPIQKDELPPDPQLFQKYFCSKK
jgi:hypothetical protein